MFPPLLFLGKFCEGLKGLHLCHLTLLLVNICISNHLCLVGVSFQCFFHANIRNTNICSYDWMDEKREERWNSYPQVFQCKKSWILTVKTTLANSPRSTLPIIPNIYVKTATLIKFSLPVLSLYPVTGLTLKWRLWTSSGPLNGNHTTLPSPFNCSSWLFHTSFSKPFSTNSLSGHNLLLYLPEKTEPKERASTYPHWTNVFSLWLVCCFFIVLSQ